MAAGCVAGFAAPGTVFGTGIGSAETKADPVEVSKLCASMDAPANDGVGTRRPAMMPSSKRRYITRCMDESFLAGETEVSERIKELSNDSFMLPNRPIEQDKDR